MSYCEYLLKLVMKLPYEPLPPSSIDVKKSKIVPEYSPSNADDTQVLAKTVIQIGTNEIFQDDVFIFETELESPKWELEIYKGNWEIPGHRLSKNSYKTNSFTMDGFYLSYPNSIYLVITINGIYRRSMGKIELTNIKLLRDGVDKFRYNSIYGEDIDIGKINLRSGWNFISIPKNLDPSNNTAEKIFSSIAAEEKAIVSYNAETQKWEQADGDTKIIPLTGYWIYSKTNRTINLSFQTTPSAPPSKILYKGWNAAGLSAVEQISAKSALAEINWTTLIEWNAASGKFNTAIVNNGSDANSSEKLLTPGNGFWIYVNEEGILKGLTA